MHPYCCEKDNVKPAHCSSQHIQRGQMVVHPFDGQCSMEALPCAAKLQCGFHCDNLMTAASERCNIAPRARANVDHRDRLCREQVNQVPIDLCESDALVLRGQSRCIGTVSSCAGNCSGHGCATRIWHVLALHSARLLLADEGHAISIESAPRPFRSFPRFWACRPLPSDRSRWLSGRLRSGSVNYRLRRLETPRPSEANVRNQPQAAGSATKQTLSDSRPGN